MSTPSETSIANAALTLLGEKRIDSIDANTKTAKTIKERFDEVRDETLRAHPWNFATKRVQLAKDSDAPAWGFDNAYTLPSDLLRLLRIENRANWPYRVEGRKIVTDIDAPLNIEYTYSATDPMEMDVMFRQAFAAALAADIAEAITGDSGKVQQMLAIMDAKIRAARVPDGQEPSPPEILASEFLDAREPDGYSRGIPSGPGTPL